MSKIALIGGAGFIGHHLALRLRRDHHDVLVLDNGCWNSVVDNAMASDSLKKRLYRSFLDERFFLMDTAGVHMQNVDALDARSTAVAIRAFGADEIVHLSAISSALEARKRPGLCFDLQLVTLRNVLEVARDVGARVTLMSSSTVYGDFEGESVTEDTRPKPRGIYANTKYMAERLTRTYSDAYDIPTVIIRPSALYGERCISGRVTQKFVEAALSGEVITLHNNGKGMLDFTHVADLVDGIAAIYKKLKREGTHTFNLTRGQARPVAALAEIIADIMPCRIENTPSTSEAPVRGTLSIERARNILGYQPKHSIEQAYQSYCLAYRSQWRAQEENHQRPDFGFRYIDSDEEVSA